MPNENDFPPRNEGSKLVPGTAVGVGLGGALLVSLVQNLPDDYVWKTWLVIIAPPASIALNNFVLWLSAWLKAKGDEREKRKETAESKQEASEREKKITEIERTFANGLQNPGTSDEIKEKITEHLGQYGVRDVEALEYERLFKIHDDLLSAKQ